MPWECGCGVVNRGSKVKCRSCATPQGTVSTPQGSQQSATGVKKRRPSGFSLADIPLFHSLRTAEPLIMIVIISVIAVPIVVGRLIHYSRAAQDTKTAVMQAIKYGQDKGVYPTSLAVLREEGYANVPDTDPWGNEWVLSPVLTRGNEPKEDDNVYVFSRGQKGTGVYPQPFTSETGREGSIGYSSVHGHWGYQ